MKAKFLVMLSLTILFFIIVVQNVAASSAFVIAEKKAAGYQYTVIKEQNTYTWKIGYQGNISVIQEDENNKEDLEKFMHAVGDSNLEMIKLILSTSYFLIVVLTGLILYKKNKKIHKDLALVIVVFVSIALYFILVTSLDLNSSLADAKYYYLDLIN
ncbi:hypothetical protein [Psychrobacillus sp.]|uniref:hypothetical protein n=1 Tax=Psychrobacillus sp. TaxID=1871623 RepID=UPI0028BEACDA|nr:hypothetical protein [Psychrobacillus sp.]